MRVLPNGLLKYDYEEVRKMPQFMQNIHYRLHNRDQNYTMAITGDPGTGKSYASLALCHAIDPNFSIERNVIFDPVQFIELVNSKDTYQGMAVLWEEVGVGIDAKTWYAPINRAISHVAQTFRKKHMCLVMTVPDASMFDSTVRKLLNAYVEMDEDMDREHNVSRGRVYIPKYSYRFKKEYFSAPQYNLKRNKRPMTVSKLVFPKVGTELAQAYEKRRAEFMRSKGGEIEEDMKASLQKTAKRRTPKEIAALISMKPDKYYSDKGGIDSAAIMLYHDVNRTYANEIRRMAEILLRGKS